MTLLCFAQKEIHVKEQKYHSRYFSVLLTCIRTDALYMGAGVCVCVLDYCTSAINVSLITCPSVEREAGSYPSPWLINQGKNCT